MFFLAKKKEINNRLNNAFSVVHENIHWLKEWANYLDEDHSNTKYLVSQLTEGHTLTKQDVYNLKQWINHFNKFNKDILEHIKDISHRLGEIQSNHSGHQRQIDDIRNHKQEIERIFQKFEKDMLEKIAVLEADKAVLTGKIEELKPELTRHINELLNKASRERPTVESNEERLPRNSIPHEKPRKLLSDFSAELTSTEKRIILEFCKGDQKLTYRDIAVILEKSPNTIKNHINSIKSKGFPIKESFGIKGKRYYVDENMRKILLNQN